MKLQTQGTFVRRFFITISALGILAIAACKNQSEVKIPVIGLNSKGEQVSVLMPKSFLTRHLSRMISKSQAEVVKALPPEQEHKSWSLARVTIGLEFVAEFEVFDLIELEAAPSLELRFEKLPNNI